MMWRLRERSDEDLLVATAAEPEAFAVFYRRHLRAVVALLFHRTQDHELTADLCAEVFAAALEGVERFDPALGPARGWLFGIAGHKLQESWRRGRVEASARQRLGMPARALSDDDLQRVEELADISRSGGLWAALVDDLPPEQRDAVLARVVHERDYAEIATELRCSEAVIRQRVSRGLGRMRRRLAEGER